MTYSGKSGACGATPARLSFDGAVVLSPFSWNFRDYMMQTTHYVTQEFARRCPTVLVEPPVQWNPCGEQFRLHRLPRAVFGRRTHSPEPCLWVLHRRGLPFGRHDLFRDIDLARNAKALRRLLKELGFRRTLLWHSFPFWSTRLVEAVDPALFAYHCLDHSARETEEATLIRQADVTFAVSEPLAKRLANINPNTYFLPNGVDLSLFDPTNPGNHAVPSDLPPASRLIGFIGHINQHLDLELLLRSAQAFPGNHLVLLGRIMNNETAPQGRQAEALHTLLGLPNVSYLGFKPPRELPRYLRAFDVCVMAFLDDPFNDERDPLKFYQYLAMGKAIVTTPIPVADRYRNLCYVARSAEEFIDFIARALSEPDSQTRATERIAVARTLGWDAVVSRACEILNQVGDPRARPARGEDKP